MDESELDELVARCLVHLGGSPDDAQLLARMAGLWLEPQLGASARLQRGIVTYDPSDADRETTVARIAVRHLLKLEGFASCARAALDAIAERLIVRPVRLSRALIA